MPLPITPGRYRQSSSPLRELSPQSQHSAVKENHAPPADTPQPLIYSTILASHDALCSPASVPLPCTPANVTVSPLARNKANISVRRTRPDSHLILSPPRKGHAERVHNIFESASRVPLPHSPYIGGPAASRAASNPASASDDSEAPHLSNSRPSTPISDLIASTTESDQEGTDECVELPRARLDRNVDLSRASSDEWTGDDEFLGRQSQSSGLIQTRAHTSPGDPNSRLTSASPVNKKHASFSHNSHSPRVPCLASRFRARPDGRKVPKRPGQTLIASSPSLTSSAEIYYPLLAHHSNTSTPPTKQSSESDGTATARAGRLFASAKMIQGSGEPDASDDADEDSDSSSDAPLSLSGPLSPKVEIYRGAARLRQEPRSYSRHVGVANRKRCLGYNDDDALVGL